MGPRECLDQPREGRQGEQGAQRCCWRPRSGHLRKRDGSGRKPRSLCVQIDDAWLCPQDRTQLINAHCFFILKNLRDPQNSFKGEKSARGHAPSWGAGIRKRTLPPLTPGPLSRGGMGLAERRDLFLLPFRATPAAHGGSQARGRIRAIVASLHHSHSNTGSKLCL